MTTEPINAGRDYAVLAASVRTGGNRDETMAELVDVMWNALAHKAVSWLGFYLPGERDELVLGARRDKPACSPIGLHGVCGRSFREKRTLISADVRTLGNEHVTCDPLNLSEIVVPMIESDGSCWGVLDLDSYAIGAFSDRDAEGLSSLLVAAGLSDRKPSAPPLHL